ncbi:hypothetical protein WMY93_016417 [Mugilogobius chulae]|uniref:Endonuclease/exonuclease/phosphatase domain-containing protein n=1 Tax=Mugilogobius chulae TaxID=88201 RepID=A0AAW0NTI3_9GOBI
MGDLNARVGDEKIEGVVGVYGVPGKNDSGERLIGMCTEREMVIGNTWFRKKEIHKYTWVRQAGGRVIDKAMMDYVVVSKGACGRLLDVSVKRGESGGMSDHYLVEGRLRVGMPWVRSRRSGDVREVLRVSVLKNREKVCEYQGKISGRWNEVKDQMVVGVEEEWQQFKSAVVGCAEEVCGMRRVGGGVRKGSEWWCEDVRLAVTEKRRAYEVWQQRKDRKSYECYKEKRSATKRAVREARVAADERWGRRLTDNFRESKKMFWKEVKRVRKGVSGREERVKTEDGRMLNEGNEVRKRWAEYFERLLNVEEDRDAVIVMDGSESRSNVLGELNEALIAREEVEQAVGKLIAGKAAGHSARQLPLLPCPLIFSFCFWEFQKQLSLVSGDTLPPGPDSAHLACCDVLRDVPCMWFIKTQ